MPDYITKTINFDWCEVRVNEADWAGHTAAGLAFQLLQLQAIRRFEETLLFLKGKGLVHGPVHSSIGQEAVAVGAMAGLRPEDKIVSTHRAHHHFLAKAFHAICPAGFNPLTEKPPEALQEAVDRTLAEIMGLAPGWCGGRGGSMHLRAPEIGVLGTSAIVAGGIALATGAAWAQKLSKTGDILMAFFGDGAVNQGIFHEALNLGALWEAPIIYLIENNGYAVATGVSAATHLHEGRLSQRAAAYDMPARIVDGMNPLAVQAAVEAAAAALRRGGHPYLIEALTYRFFHHAGDLPGSGFAYRSKEEEEAWRARDPLPEFRRALLDRGILSSEQAAGLAAMAEEIVQKATTFCTEDGVRIRAGLWPAPESVCRGVRSSGAEFAGVRYAPDAPSGPAREMTYVAAIAAVTGRQLEQDPRVFVLGEEVSNMGGGAYRATKGLAQRCPGRVLSTPISEAGFSGFALGAALAGMRPVVEIMFPDFVLVAADQIFNHIAMLRHVYGGDMPVPLVMRTRVAIGAGYGGQHSMEPAGLFALFPGWRIVAPGTPYDYIGLFNSAMRCEDPVLILEHQALYERKGPVPPDDVGYLLPLDRAHLVKPGMQVTVLTYGALVPRIAALVQEDEAVELIDLRVLDRAHVDYELIGQSLRKTGALVIADEATRSGSISAMIAQECQERFFDYLDCPIRRITAADAPKPVSLALEKAAIPSDEEIRSAISRAVQREA
ncbi:MAG: MFS transporter [Chloroflexi bacterium HGW-Chloroflexi-1]|nr:MAG: MFS transporter [Chloroflexi bacterium HGW-Chloroflexi-1]